LTLVDALIVVVDLAADFAAQSHRHEPRLWSDAIRNRRSSVEREVSITCA
jgi:hypothetical protein